MLDSLSNSRPEMIRNKKKHFDIEHIGVEPMSETMHWMRINAERERICKFKEVAQECALLYYTVLEEFCIMQDKINTGQYPGNGQAGPS